MAKRKHADSGSTESGSADAAPQAPSKHKKHKKEKKEKKHKSDKKSKSDSKKHASKDSKRERAAGEDRGKEPLLDSKTQVNSISEDDYFAKNAEFTTWLKEQRQLFFNDLSAEETRRLFAEFVEAWNARRLPAKLYAGVTGSAMRRTNHQWGFKGEAAMPSAAALGMAAAMEEDREAGMADRQQGRANSALERKRWNAEQQQQLDEMLPKATGREAVMEQKAARREAARERETSPAMTRLPGGGDVMGGDDSFQAARAREAHHAQRRAMHQAVKADSLAQRASAAAAKEDDRMAAFRALAASGPITIPKRA